METFNGGDKVFVKAGKPDIWYVIDHKKNGMIQCLNLVDDLLEEFSPGQLTHERPAGSLGRIPQEYFDPSFIPSPVISAGYGTGKTFMDVTAQVRKQYSEGRRRFVASNYEFGGDPYLSAPKILAILLLTGNQLVTYVIREHTDGETLP